MLEVEGLSKKFGDLVAVDNISFSVNEGEIFGFIGPNGAGKTTAHGMLTGRYSRYDTTSNRYDRGMLHSRPFNENQFNEYSGII
ncbi:ATP-binding cassette domain-containing protein [Methanothermobacter sp.]|uniref:ATP-binding cassette domain-containing protein n=1 Tax=Methanothermobacter sp. TaxID=1884223 RepID=UPI003C719BF2